MKNEVNIYNWIDATSYEGIKLNEIENNPVIKYLTKKKHYGVIIKEDKDGIIIAHDKDGDTVDIIAIPKNFRKEDNGKKINMLLKREIHQIIIMGTTLIAGQRRDEVIEQINKIIDRHVG